MKTKKSRTILLVAALLGGLSLAPVLLAQVEEARARIDGMV